MSQRVEFLYLNEADTIRAGVNDRKACIEVCEEVFTLLTMGDYLMGGLDHNSHGECIYFPDESPFPNMPLNAPDRRFYAMPAYLGGRFHMVGNKWYGSNTKNKEKGLPRSILTLMLNDTETGAPLCLMSANLLSAARTGAIPAVGAKYLAKKDSKSLAVIACGPINRSCAEHILTQIKTIDTVYLYDLFPEACENMKRRLLESFDLDIQIMGSTEEAVRQADIITSAASRIHPLHFERAWFKAGATLILSGQAVGDEALFTDARIVFDNLKLHQSYKAGALTAESVAAYYGGYIAGPVYALMDAGKVAPLEESCAIGEIIAGNKPPRTGDELTLFYSVGMPVFDVGWGTEVYLRAQKGGIGKTLLLWDSPEL